MASRYFNQFPGTFRFGAKYVEGAAKIGSNGVPVQGSFTGGGISASSSVTLQSLGTGYYRLQLADPYYRVVWADVMHMMATSAGFIADGSLTVGQPYQILGSSANPAGQPSTATNWYTLGLYPGLNPQAGQSFIATSGASNIPGSSTQAVGNGIVAKLITSGITEIEVLPGFNTMIAPTSASSGVQGAIVQFTTLGTSASIAVNPTPGTWLRWGLWLDNSTRSLYNESSTSN